MKKIAQNLLVFTLAIMAILPMNAIAAFVVPEAETVASTTPERKTLSFTKDIKASDIENYLGRKMTGMEKLAFKINKKKLVKALNAPQILNSDRTNTWSIVGFVTSLLIAPLGVIFSLIALGQIRQTGERGEGLAIAGLVIGILGTIWIIVALL